MPGRSRSASACVDLASGRRWTYASLDDSIQRAVAVLESGYGIEPGQRIATVARNSADLLILQQAAMRIGAIFVPVNWRLAGCRAGSDPRRLRAGAAAARRRARCGAAQGLQLARGRRLRGGGRSAGTGAAPALAGRRCAVDHPLHLGHVGPAEGRDPDRAQRLRDRGQFRHSGAGRQFQHLPLRLADVPCHRPHHQPASRRCCKAGRC